MTGSSRVPDVPEIQLDDFARVYKTFVDAGKDGQLLAKCMSDYKYGNEDGNSLQNDSTCFKVEGNQIKDKDGNVINLDEITAHDLGDYDDPTNITLKDIQEKVNDNSYHFISGDFMDDWKDLRTSLGNIPLDDNNEYNMSGVTSDRLGGYHDRFNNEIRDKHKDILKKRNNLDNKMREMYGEKGDPDFNLDASVYSTMLFTIMTTSLLYYLFIKM